ncbi:hypothetical protein [Erysipelothrix aquatica]|uniref:hypothetical protein n=1 Tax=Erysipelothrix aquatica TaxID=2683714 RepID=UPI0013594F24|nr:hypothetical protein [Erysipelothrix aquatica]
MFLVRSKNDLKFEDGMFEIKTGRQHIVIPLNTIDHYVFKRNLKMTDGDVDTITLYNQFHDQLFEIRIQDSNIAEQCNIALAYQLKQKNLIKEIQDEQSTFNRNNL